MVYLPPSCICGHAADEHREPEVLTWENIGAFPCAKCGCPNYTNPLVRPKETTL